MQGIPTWIDRNDIKPGTNWKVAIRAAIRKGSYFIACFSHQYVKREKTYMNAELRFALEELATYSSSRPWLLPILFDNCELPDFESLGNSSFRDIQAIPFYSGWDAGIKSVVSTIVGESKTHPDPNSTAVVKARTREYVQELKKLLSQTHNKTVRIYAYGCNNDEIKVGERGRIEVKYRYAVEFIRGSGLWHDWWHKDHYCWELYVDAHDNIVAESRFRESDK
jgi:hypothetical protein